MFCTQCGKANPDDARFCASCGREVQPAAPVAASPVPPATPASRSTPAAPPVAAPAQGPVASPQPEASAQTPAMLREEVPPVYAPAQPPVAQPTPVSPVPPQQPPPQARTPQPGAPQPVAAPGYALAAALPAAYPAYAGPPGGVGFSFWGTGWQALGWGLLNYLLAATWFGTAWGLEYLYKWFFSKLRLSDNTTVQFAGSGGQVWWVPVVGMLPLMLANLVSALPSIAQQLPLEAEIQRILLTSGTIAMAVLMVPGVIAMCWVVVRMTRWALENLVLGCGTRLTFTGTLWQCLGWTLLLWLSVYSIIGWAWVMVAMIKWLFRNTASSGGHQLVFHGTGGEVLWRYLVVGLVVGVTLGIAAPWMAVWLVKWAASRTSVLTAAR